MKGQLKQADRVGARATRDRRRDGIEVKDMDSGEQTGRSRAPTRPSSGCGSCSR